jgi:MoaA/NifB/PqqE/SkfB family radical SAM enzyme
MSNSIIKQIVKSKFSDLTPQYVIAFVTGHCNLSCDFCVYTAKKVREYDNLSPKQWGNFFNDVNGLVHLTISGGEPFLREDLFEVVCEIIRKTKVPSISVNTNGFFPDRVINFLDKFDKKFPEIGLMISISLDGDKETHNLVRKNPHAWKKALQTKDLIIQNKKNWKNIEFSLATVLQPENKNTIEDFVNEIDHPSIDFHHVLMLRDVSNEVQRGLLETYTRVSSKQLLKLVKRKKFKLFALQRALRNEIVRRIKNPNKLIECSAGKNIIEILPDGQVLGCELEKVKDKSNLGKLDSKTGLRKLLDSKPAKEFRENVASNCNCSFECSITSDLVFNSKNITKVLF